MREKSEGESSGSLDDDDNFDSRISVINRGVKIFRISVINRGMKSQYSDDDI